MKEAIELGKELFEFISDNNIENLDLLNIQCMSNNYLIDCPRFYNNTDYLEFLYRYTKVFTDIYQVPTWILDVSPGITFDLIRKDIFEYYPVSFNALDPASWKQFDNPKLSLKEIIITSVLYKKDAVLSIKVVVRYERIEI